MLSRLGGRSINRSYRIGDLNGWLKVETLVALSSPLWDGNKNYHQIINTLMDSKIFGDKSIFAIETKPYKIPQKHYLRIWFNDKVFGDFKKGGSLDYMINAYFKFLKHQHGLFESKFRIMSAREIYSDVVLVLFTEIPDELRAELHARCEKYGFTLGDHQFNNYSFLFLDLEKEQQVQIVIYEMDGESDAKAYSYTIEKDYFLSVYKEFIRYAYQNDLKKHKPFFPADFSYDDIND